MSDGAGRAAPAVRRLAEEHNIDLNAVPGTGPGGRVTREDILSIATARQQTAAPVAPSAPAPAPAPEAEPPAPADTDDADLPAALRMRAAQQLTVVADADAKDRADKPHDHP